jgi:site-specific recombinase XerD
VSESDETYPKPEINDSGLISGAESRDRDLIESNSESRRLTAQEFQSLADVPPELEWLANIDNFNTRRAYKADIREFQRFVGVKEPEEFRLVTRSHVIAWRKDFERRELEPNTIRRKLSALASLFAYLAENNAILHNPVHGVKRPNTDANIGKTPAFSDAQAKALLNAPPTDTLKGIRDRAILSVLLYHGLRREELCKLRVIDFHQRRGLWHFRVHGKGDKTRFILVHVSTVHLVREYLQIAGNINNASAPLFKPIKNNRTLGKQNRALHPSSIYNIVTEYALKVGISNTPNLGPHACRATAATNALEHQSDIARVQHWLGHASISTTRIYDHRNSRPKDSPTNRIIY